jgi:hypothetical protein
MKIAVIGGGVFGCTIALDLAKTGATVQLFEERNDIFEGATVRNQARLHYGYHYPRSDETALTAKAAATVFTERFPETVKRARHWYVVAPDSKVTPSEYLMFLHRIGLPYEVVQHQKGSLVPPPQVHTAALIIRASEGFIDTSVLRRSLLRELKYRNIVVSTNNRVHESQVPGFDKTVWATYGVPWSKPLRFEVCEVALLELGRYANDSFVIVDGDFVSLDPHGPTHTLYDVAHSVHHVSKGLVPSVPESYAALLKQGITRAGAQGSELSHVDKMIESGSRFLWGLEPGGQHTSIYHGSLWSLRAVLPTVDATDARPTLVEQDVDNPNVIRVLSGKICMAATVGQAVVDALHLCEREPV